MLRNVGIEYAQTDLVLLIENDFETPIDLSQKILQQLEKFDLSTDKQVVSIFITSTSFTRCVQLNTVGVKST